MNRGETVSILPSHALRQMKLSDIIGWRATIVEIVGKAGEIKGCWVRLPKPHLGEIEWYIPYNSIGI